MPHEPNLTAYLRGPDDVDDKSVSSFVDEFALLTISMFSIAKANEDVQAKLVGVEKSGTKLHIMRLPT